MTSSKSRTLLQWLKDPASIISLSAAILSVTTFYLVYIQKGTIEITLPQNIGMGILPYNKHLGLIVSATYYNTGAPSRAHHIHNITVYISGNEKKTPIDGKYKWTFEQRYVGAEEWLQKYKKKDQNTRDYLEYVGRNIPFTVRGGESVTKTIELEGEQSKSIILPSTIQLELTVHTESDIFRTMAVYTCQPDSFLEVGKATQCERQEPNR